MLFFNDTHRVGTVLPSFASFFQASAVHEGAIRVNGAVVERVGQARQGGALQHGVSTISLSVYLVFFSGCKKK